MRLWPKEHLHAAAIDASQKDTLGTKLGIHGNAVATGKIQDASKRTQYARPHLYPICVVCQQSTKPITTNVCLVRFAKMSQFESHSSQPVQPSMCVCIYWSTEYIRHCPIRRLVFNGECARMYQSGHTITTPHSQLSAQIIATTSGFRWPSITIWQSRRTVNNNSKLSDAKATSPKIRLLSLIQNVHKPWKVNLYYSRLEPRALSRPGDFTSHFRYFCTCAFKTPWNSLLTID